MAEAGLRLTSLGMTLQKPGELKEPSETDDAYTLTELDPSGTKFKEISVDFKNAGLNIVKIEQLGNHLLWHKYKSERKSTEKRKKKDPKFDLNEKYLYHGTTAKKDYICTEGLDARLSKKGRFGAGIYFSDNPLKCVKYAEKNDSKHFILLARVILGCSKEYPPGQSDPMLLREPEKKHPYTGWRFYDSAVGCPKDLKEYVIYRNDKALIDCIVTYSKASITPPIPKARTMFYSPTNLLSTPSSKQFTKVVPTNDNTDTDSDDEDVKAGDLSTSDEDENGTSTDSDGEDTRRGAANGFSSDSSLEDHSQNVRRPHVSRNNHPSPMKRYAPKTDVKTGLFVLAEKKRQFALKTGERSQHVIESYLSITGLDVDRAVQLFQDKERKRRDMEKKHETSQSQKEDSPDKESDAFEDAASGNYVNHASDPEKWRQMGTEDKAAIVDALTENLLTVVGLDDSPHNRVLSRRILMSCDCDLDSAIVAYYESI